MSASLFSPAVNNQRQISPILFVNQVGHWEQQCFVVFCCCNVLGFWGVFEVSVKNFRVLGVLVSYKITRGIKLIVGRVTEGVWFFLHVECIFIGPW